MARSSAASWKRLRRGGASMSILWPIVLAENMRISTTCEEGRVSPRATAAGDGRPVNSASYSNRTIGSKGSGLRADRFLQCHSLCRRPQTVPAPKRSGRRGGSGTVFCAPDLAFPFARGCRPYGWEGGYMLKDWRSDDCFMLLWVQSKAFRRRGGEMRCTGGGGEGMMGRTSGFGRSDSGQTWPYRDRGLRWTRRSSSRRCR